jgi:hypothetical protein
LVSNQIPGFGGGPDPWSLPDREQFRQAIALLRGYVYQLHHSLAAWIALPLGAELHLEVAEDYATVARDPTALDEVLTAPLPWPARMAAEQRHAGACRGTANEHRGPSDLC